MSELEYPFWRVVVQGRRSITEVESWDLEQLEKVNNFMNMQNDYTVACQEFYEHEAEKKNKRK